MTMALILPVAAGGALGASARYLMGGVAMRMAGVGFPYGTLMVNVLGSLFIGLVAGWFLRDMVEAKPVLQAFVITGFLGGFTTFSAFSLEAISMLQRGDYLSGLAYVGLSVLLALTACGLGIALVKAV